MIFKYIIEDKILNNFFLYIYVYTEQSVLTFKIFAKKKIANYT